MKIVQADIEDQICIHVDGTTITVYASDVVHAIRDFHEQQEAARKEAGLPLAGTVMPDGTVLFGPYPVDTESDDPLL